MCWTSSIAIPIILKKPLRVYKLGTPTILNGFISSYQNFMYLKGKILPTIEINPIFERRYFPTSLMGDTWDSDIFYIFEGYHSYLTKKIAKLRRYSSDKIGIFEIPSGATIYVNYRYEEVVSTDIKYLGLLE